MGLGKSVVILMNPALAKDNLLGKALILFVEGLIS